jgi:hypothetical protein
MHASIELMIGRLDTTSPEIGNWGLGEVSRKKVNCRLTRCGNKSNKKIFVSTHCSNEARAKVDKA